jgi:CBS domain-containing protein
MLVKEIMTPKMETAGPNLTLQDAARKMRDLNIGALPISEDGRLIGMVTDRDICCRGVADGLDPATTPLRAVMSRQIACCFSDDTIPDAILQMEHKHIRRLAVVNRDQTFAGMLSVDDLARYSRHVAGEVIDQARPGH